MKPTRLEDLCIGDVMVHNDTKYKIKLIDLKTRRVIDETIGTGRENILTEDEYIACFTIGQDAKLVRNNFAKYKERFRAAV
jgi:hypothetical protein